MTRPPWTPEMSDGASAPAFIRRVLDLDDPTYRRIWQDHDCAYYVGGGERDRLLADARMLLACLDAGMPAQDAEQVYQAVRAFGESHFYYHDAKPAPAEAP